MKWIKYARGDYRSGGYRARQYAPRDRKTGWWLHYKGKALGFGGSLAAAKIAAELHAEGKSAVSFKTT
jgi:hypothetical protein